jgi:hypothetical protein
VLGVVDECVLGAVADVALGSCQEQQQARSGGQEAAALGASPAVGMVWADWRQAAGCCPVEPVRAIFLREGGLRPASSRGPRGWPENGRD